MTTVVARYLANPTPANAARVVAYLDKHPFADIAASHLELALIAECRALRG